MSVIMYQQLLFNFKYTYRVTTAYKKCKIKQICKLGRNNFVTNLFQPTATIIAIFQSQIAFLDQFPH
jgi:hypothetical protein